MFSSITAKTRPVFENKFFKKWWYNRAAHRSSRPVYNLHRRTSFSWKMLSIFVSHTHTHTHSHTHAHTHKHTHTHTHSPSLTLTFRKKFWRGYVNSRLKLSHQRSFVEKICSLIDRFSLNLTCSFNPKGSFINDVTQRGGREVDLFVIDWLNHL